MTLDQFLALRERTRFLDSLRNVVDAVDQLPMTGVLAFHLQCLELGGRIDALPDRPLGNRWRVAGADKRG